jgi:purine nucleosidase
LRISGEIQRGAGIPFRVMCMKIRQLVFSLSAGALLLAGLTAAGGGDVAAQMAAAKPQLVLLDTDIGDDIDDAFALALALNSPELKLLGITTAFGDTGLRAQLANRYLEAAGRSDIPVHVGVRTTANNVFTQRAYAARGRSSPNDDGVAFLLDQIRAHPGEITLIAIGPLNNIEAAIKRDPKTFRKLRRAVVMAGSIYRGYDDKNGVNRTPDAEWNVNRDPAGLRALLASGVPVFLMPLDSTQIRLETARREAIFAHGSPVTDQLTLLYHQWKAGSESHWEAPTLYDPVAVTYAIRPDLCPATPMRIEVDDKGFTRPVEGAANAQVCLKSDEQGFLEALVGRLTNDVPAPLQGMAHSPMTRLSTKLTAALVLDNGT